MQAVWKMLVLGSVFGVALAGVGVGFSTQQAWAGDGDCASQGGDQDLDQICSDNDNCPDTANTNQNDTDGNGIGDACECGDHNLDGTANTTDARLTQRCAVGQIPCAGLCDANNDGICNTTDARLVQRAAVGQLSKLNDLSCAERP